MQAEQPHMDVVVPQKLEEFISESLALDVGDSLSAEELPQRVGV